MIVDKITAVLQRPLTDNVSELEEGSQEDSDEEMSDDEGYDDMMMWLPTRREESTQ